MGIEDYIIIGVVALIVALALFYVIRAKKRGVKCIGCPSGGCNCGSHKGGAEESGACSGSCGSCSCGCGGEKPSEASENDPEA